MIVVIGGRRFRIHDREEWQLPSRPVTGPAPYPNLVHHAVIHWPGASNNWQPPLDVASHLRWAQDSYLSDPNRGYSYGYGFVVGPNPVDWNADPVPLDLWEVRGNDIRIASNDGDNGVFGTYSNPNFNGRSTSLQVMASAVYRATSDQIETARWWVQWQDDVYGERLTVIPHRTSDATYCPGDDLAGKIGYIATRPSDVAPPPPPPVQPPPAAGSYTVVAGDGWYLISYRVGVSAARLAAANGATFETVLHPGQVIVIPAPERSYTARPGDGLWTVARALGLPTTETTYSRLTHQLHYRYGRSGLYPGDVLTA